MSFTLIDTDYTDKIKTILSSFNLINLNYDKLHISGSLVLNLIRNDDNLDSSDLDLYFNIYKMNKYEIETIISQFINSGYYLKQPKFESLEDDDLKIRNKHSTKSYIINKIVQKILNSKKYNNFDEVVSYFSLRNHIINIIRLYNPTINKEVDLIVLKPKKVNTIQKLLLETFDYNIVKNYTEYDKENDKYLVYSYDQESIKNNIATISLNHFSNRILDNIHEFDNFITRYVKYQYLKKWKIYIDKVEITNEYFINMVKLYLDNTLLTFIIYDNYKSVSYLNINNDITDLSKIFKIILKKYDNGDEIIEYDYNLRKYINEFKSSNFFKQNQIKDEILSYYGNILSKSIITENNINLSSEVERLFNQQISNSLRLLQINNECVICYEKKYLYDIYCGNNHKLCGQCLRSMINKTCPYCRVKLFSK